MLTADLARSRRQGGRIRPLFLDTDDEHYREAAEQLIGIFEDHVGKPKGDLEETIEELTVADTDYKILQGLAKLLKDECTFETVAAADPRAIRTRLFERANESYPIVRQPTLGEDTRRLEVYSAVAGQLGITLKECYRGMYADLEANKCLVQFGGQSVETDTDVDDASATTKLTDDSEEAYVDHGISTDWLLTRYNLALAQAVLYDATEMRIRVWDHFGTVFTYVKLFGLMHRIYPIDVDGERRENADAAAGYEAILDGPASLFSQSRKYGIRMANLLPALPLTNRWEMAADILAGETTGDQLLFELDHTDGLGSHYTAQDVFDSDLERTFARKWDRANTDWELHRERDVLDLGDEVMIPDFALEHPDGRRAILEIVGFWTPEYLEKKLAKIRGADTDHLVLAVSERLQCDESDFGAAADRVLWFKTGIHVYDVVELAEEYARPVSDAEKRQS